MAQGAAIYHYHRVCLKPLYQLIEPLKINDPCCCLLLAYFLLNVYSALKMEAVLFSETSVNFHRTYTQKSPLWEPEPVWTLWRREIFLAPARTRIPVVQPVAHRYADWDIEAGAVAVNAATCSELLKTLSFVQDLLKFSSRKQSFITH
jgi:hypothetical protein